MVNKAVATKLSEEEHSKLIEACNKEGSTPSALIKKAIMQVIEPKETESKKEPKDDKFRKMLEGLHEKAELRKTMEQISEELGLVKRKDLEDLKKQIEFKKLNLCCR